MASLVASAPVSLRFDRVLTVTAKAWGIPLPLPQPRVLRVRAPRPTVARDCRRAATAFCGFAISY